jgi:hypothetical protein
MKVKVSEAKGRVLDYLVAQAMGMKIYVASQVGG